MNRYHQPCGFKNNTVQVNNKTFCSEKHARKERRQLEVKERKTSEKEQRKRKNIGRPKKIVPKNRENSSSFSSQNDEEKYEKEDFSFYKVINLHPIDASKPSTYIDNAESNEVQSPSENMIMQEGGPMEGIIIVDSGTIDVKEHGIQLQVSFEATSSPSTTDQGE